MKLTEKMKIGLYSYENNIKGEDLLVSRQIKNEYFQIYSSMPKELINIFAYIHSELDKHINEANRRYEKEQVRLLNEANNTEYGLFYFKSNDSRNLRTLIKEIEDIINLVRTTVTIEINEEYKEFLFNMKTELKVHGGNNIYNYRIYKVLRFQPIFEITNVENMGDVKSIIFASNKEKPDIIITDTLDMNIEILNNETACLVYDRAIINNNLNWSELISWWKTKSKSLLLDRLCEIYDAKSNELKFLKSYINFCKGFKDEDWNLPALIPEVYLHYDPITLKELVKNKKDKRLTHQRMDFLMLINGKRLIIELDGKQHYSDKDGPSPKKYAKMVEYDRKMKLLGYDVYRFGGYEFIQPNYESKLHDFFKKIYLKYAPHLYETIE